MKLSLDKNSDIVLIVAAVSIVFLILLLTLSSGNPGDEVLSDSINSPLKKLNEFGFNSDSLAVKELKIKRNDTFSTILSGYNISYDYILNLAERSKPVFNVRDLKFGNRYYTYSSKTKSDSLLYLVYEKDMIDFVVYDLRDSIKVYEGSHKLELRRKSISTIINNSLYEAIDGKGGDPELAMKLSEIYAWQIDFFKLQKGDSIKVIYNESYVKDNPVGINKVVGAEFRHGGNTFYAFRFKEGGKPGFFDENGRSLRKAFLKAPLKFTRISSHFTKRRFHPVLHRYKAHLGTDYAADVGTPIHTVGDGVVIAARYSKYNGRYVKVKHNSVYTTQYLHMSRIAKGIKPGARVKQGQIIGYVGSTGLATGPHLCFRFWMNGKQVDPFKVKIPPSRPVQKEYVDQFNQKKNEVLAELMRIENDDDGDGEKSL